MEPAYLTAIKRSTVRGSCLTSSNGFRHWISPLIRSPLRSALGPIQLTTEMVKPIGQTTHRRPRLESKSARVERLSEFILHTLAKRWNGRIGHSRTDPDGTPSDCTEGKSHNTRVRKIGNSRKLSVEGIRKSTETWGKNTTTYNPQNRRAR